ncbi:MAG: hypothetical protein FWG74_03715 [Planctomycetes bacterium]|nr:hypothetical protein [Planctomycetota bacterium]
MTNELKKSADALWAEVMSKAGMIERRALNNRQKMFYDFIEKHFGPAYNELAAMKEQG